MSRIFNSVIDLIGHTPLLRANNFISTQKIEADLLVKLEYFNPAGSAKDRIAKAMLLEAKNKGLLTTDTVIIEPTSGNTGIGLASVASSMGYKTVLTMPDTMSKERRDLLAAYGAEIVLTPGEKGMQGAIDKANELAEKFPHAYIPAQFDNPDNALAHYQTTGPEIWQDTDGQVDIFVAGIGTGGTLTGTGKYLKEQNPSLHIVAVEPADSPLLSAGKAGSHKLQGIGANFIPKILDTDLYDEIIPVTTEEAFEAARIFSSAEGILAGISGGASLYAAMKIAQRPENKGKVIAVILPDSGEKYLSTGLFTKA